MTPSMQNLYDLVPLESSSALQFARALTAAFTRAGEDLFMVGGAVRDLLLGREIDELDFATSARPDISAQILGDLLGKEPHRVGEKFGTIGGMFQDFHVEITTFRSSEVYAPHSRKPSVVFGNTIFEDLARRDFTINAIGCDALRGDLIDPEGGVPDLEMRCLRSVGSAEQRFHEDPLRLLRAVRFSSRLELTISEETWHAMNVASPSLLTISRERIRDEYTRILLSDKPARGLTLLRDANLMKYSVPELLELATMPDHGPRHPLSLWDHTLRVVEGVQPTLILRWAALLHDIGKPSTRTREPSGRPRFFHHEEVGAIIARAVLEGLRYPKDSVSAAVLLVESHMQLHAYDAEWSDGAVRRLCLRLGSCLDDAIELARADAAGHAPDGSSANAGKFDELEVRLEDLGRRETEALKSPLTGDDLMARYGRPPGPWIRQVKDALLEEVLEGRLQADDIETAQRLADSLVKGA